MLISIKRQCDLRAHSSPSLFRPSSFFESVGTMHSLRGTTENSPGIMNEPMPGTSLGQSHLFKLNPHCKRTLNLPAACKVCLIHCYVSSTRDGA